MFNLKNILRIVAILAIGGILISLICFSVVAITAAVAGEETEQEIISTIATEPLEEETQPSTEPTEIAKLNTPLLFSEIEYVKPTNITDAYLMVDAINNAINLLWNELECPLYTDFARSVMEHELARLNDIFEQTQYDINCFILWEEKLAEYPYAAQLWLYLKDLGYSDVACAGILGNAMAECGGNTLRINPFAYSRDGNYYGIFQWSKVYYGGIHGASFEEQLEFFRNTVQIIFKNWGKNYGHGFTHDDFNKLESPRETALAFAKIYERCASWTYERRQNFAEVAYKYFVLDFEELC